MTADDLTLLVKSLAPAVHGFVTKSLTGLTERLIALEQRLASVRDGRDGQPGLMGPQGEKGLDGTHGSNGRDGVDGKDGLTGPTGEKGLDGRDGRDGKDGRDGDPGVQGERGEKGLDGLNGANGTDGFGFDGFEVCYDGERDITFRFTQGEKVKTFDFVLPIVIDRGVYQPGRSYEKGDGATWGGSYWIAQQATTAKPGEASEASRAWRLAVKKGADGKQGPDGKSGGPGPRGDKGDPGPRIY
jgi:integrin beta 3